MKCSNIIEKLEELCPLSCACEWDNPGLLAGRQHKEVKKVLLALDATDQVVEEAIRQQADMLITHHPLIFKPLKKVNDQDFISRRILKLIQSDISYYAMHTNFDSAPGCMGAVSYTHLFCRPFCHRQRCSYDGMGDCTGTVSYTHLDVYKRQNLFRARTGYGAVRP